MIKNDGRCRCECAVSIDEQTNESMFVYSIHLEFQVLLDYLATQMLGVVNYHTLYGSNKRIIYQYFQSARPGLNLHGGRCSRVENDRRWHWEDAESGLSCELVGLFLEFLVVLDLLVTLIIVSCLN